MTDSRRNLWSEEDEEPKNEPEVPADDQVEEDEFQGTFRCDEGHTFTAEEAEQLRFICPEDNGALIPADLY